LSYEHGPSVPCSRARGAAGPGPDAFPSSVGVLVRFFPGLAKRLAIVHMEEDGNHIAGVVGFFLAAVVLLLI